jgi:hypothetical protein
MAFITYHFAMRMNATLRGIDGHYTVSEMLDSLTEFIQFVMESDEPLLPFMIQLPSNETLGFHD